MTFFSRNDILNLKYNANGDTVARYSYDAWGKPTTVSDTTDCKIAYINPFRYRGYYYDNLINLYYLQSRYYDPETGRFLNEDVPEIATIGGDVLGHNLFAYCGNEPVNNVDPIGYEYITLAVLGKVLLTSVMIILLMYTLSAIVNSPEFQRAWNGFCIAVGGAFKSTWNTITTTANRAWTWKKNQMRSFAKALSQAITIARATSKIITAVKAVKNAYFSFYEIYYYGDMPIIGNKLNKDQAVKRAKIGGNSITYYRANALWVANKAGNARAMHHTPHGGTGYFSHFHIYKHSNSAHIAYLTI